MDPCFKQRLAPTKIMPERSPLLRERTWSPPSPPCQKKRSPYKAVLPDEDANAGKARWQGSPRKGSLVHQGSWATETGQRGCGGRGLSSLPAQVLCTPLPEGWPTQSLEAQVAGWKPPRLHEARRSQTGWAETSTVEKCTPK